MAKAAKPTNKAAKKIIKKVIRKTRILSEEEMKLRQEEKKRRDWERNDSIISTMFCDLLIKKQKLPSYEEIGRQTKLSVRTVERHLKEGDFDNFVQKFRAGNEKVMLNLFNLAATTASHNHIRLWFEITERLGSKKEIDFTSGGKPLPAPPSMMGVISIDPKTLPTDYLEKLIAEHDANNC